MAQPVIVDDGGSTRIRQVQDGYYDMDSFLEHGTAKADGSFLDQNGQARVVVRISSVQEDGSFMTPGRPAPAPSLNVPEIIMNAGNDQLTIRTSFGHTVTATLAANGQLSFTLAAPATVERFIEARQTAKRRRYIILNSGVIEKITPKNAGPGFQSDAKTIYTCVAFT